MATVAAESIPNIRASWRAPATLFATAIISNIYQLTHFPLPGFGPYYEAIAVARNLAYTGHFANPYTAVPTGPTAHLAPLLPAILALLIRLLGYSGAFVLASIALMVAANALHAALLPSVSDLLFNSRMPGIWAGALSAILPLFQIASPGDCFFLGPLLLLFLLASDRAVNRFGPAGGGVLAGCLVGILLLWSPAALIVIAIWMIRVGLLQFRTAADRLRLAATATIATFLVCLPWTLRNYRELGAFFFIRDNLGQNLLISNNDRSAPTVAENFRNGVLVKYSPNFNPSEAARIVQLGEVRYNSLCSKAAEEWCLRNPSKFVRLTGWRILRFWFPAPELPAYDWSLWLVTALSVPGLILSISRKESAAWFLSAVLLFFPLVYYITEADDRYRYPIVWASLLLAGYALALFHRGISTARQYPAGSIEVHKMGYRYRSHDITT